MNNYIMLLEHTYRNLLKADEMSLELVALCQVALAEKPEIKLKEYIKKGGEIKYSISKSQIDNKIRKISSQENKPSSEDNPRPQFVALYFDLIRVVLPTSLL